MDDVYKIFAASSPDMLCEVVEEFTAAASQQVGAGPFSAPLGKPAAFLCARIARRIYKRVRRTFLTSCGGLWRS
ncbi:hypothetical protein [Pyrobaculum calidifontis]|uniref:hypothetical protein n=1 Tax=Pyrobaculum calidifontis TaxID=181486 RepID=UPI000B280004|nr:hypothetical protein [Pyrobaculum calidifontis]